MGGGGGWTNESSRAAGVRNAIPRGRYGEGRGGGGSETEEKIDLIDSAIVSGSGEDFVVVRSLLPR